MWCIPPGRDAAFVCPREQVLEVDKRPDDPKRPVVGRDERPKHLISETRQPIAAAPGHPGRVDYESVREGVRVVWMVVEPLADWRDVRVTETKAAVDRAHQVRLLVDDPRSAEAERIALVCDDLNTHALASLERAFEPAEALRIARKLELVSTPKHGSWRNVAELELSVLTRQCLDRRIPCRAEVSREAEAWDERRNTRQVGIDWQFTTEDARIKLRHLYPKIKA